MEKRIHQKGKQKHVLSVLRKIIGASLADSKEVLGLARDTIKAIQCGRLEFSEHAAMTVADKTGVSCKWLLDMDGRKPAITDDGRPYTKQTFDRHEAKRDKDTRERSSPPNRSFYRYGCLQQFRTLTIKLAGLMLAAHQSHKVGFVNAKLDNEMRRLAKLLKEEGRAMRFESLTRKHVESTKALSNAEKEAGFIAILDRFKNELPAESWLNMKSAKSAAH